MSKFLDKMADKKEEALPELAQKMVKEIANDLKTSDLQNKSIRAQLNELGMDDDEIESKIQIEIEKAKGIIGLNTALWKILEDRKKLQTAHEQVMEKLTEKEKEDESIPIDIEINTLKKKVELLKKKKRSGSKSDSNFWNIVDDLNDSKYELRELIYEKKQKERDDRYEKHHNELIGALQKLTGTLNVKLTGIHVWPPIKVPPNQDPIELVPVPDSGGTIDPNVVVPSIQPDTTDDSKSLTRTITATDKYPELTVLSTEPRGIVDLVADFNLDFPNKKPIWHGQWTSAFKKWLKS